MRIFVDILILSAILAFVAIQAEAFWQEFWEWIRKKRSTVVYEGNPMEERIKQLHLNAGKLAGKEKTCGKKNAFETEEKAQKAAQAHNRWKERRHDVEPYPCAFCDKWHVGNVMSIELLEAMANPKKENL